MSAAVDVNHFREADTPRFHVLHGLDDPVQSAVQVHNLHGQAVLAFQLEPQFLLEDVQSTPDLLLDELLSGTQVRAGLVDYSLG